jgi:hypothetical protein
MTVELPINISPSLAGGFIKLPAKGICTGISLAAVPAWARGTPLTEIVEPSSGRYTNNHFNNGGSKRIFT